MIDGSATNVDEDDNNNNDGTSAVGHWFWSRPSVSNTSASGG